MIRYLEFVRVEIRPWIWSLLAILYLSALLPSQALTLCLLAFVSFQALKEYFSIVPMRQVERPLLMLGYLSIPLQFASVALAGYAPALAFTPLYILVVSLVGLQRHGWTPQTFNSILKIGWGVFTLVYTFSYIGLLAKFPMQIELTQNGGGLLLFLLLIVHLQRLMHFLLNRWGINDWARTISDNTLIGMASLISVLAVAVIGSSIGPHLTWLSPQQALFAGLVIGSAAYVGSATVHAVQHALYISDEDALIPGMGGIINVIYPFVYAAPLFFFLLMAFQ